MKQEHTRSEFRFYLQVVVLTPFIVVDLAPPKLESNHASDARKQVRSHTHMEKIKTSMP